jgi:hypothetical protein|tara:strand:+ start:164 stop:853 length:690 start_codon:yes stop_codon:yes gene_type:complete
MSTDQKDLNIPCFIEIFSINDFARLVCALERIPLPVLKFKVNGEFILATQIDLFHNTPILYFVKIKEEGNFIMYKQKNGKETVEMSNSTKDRMGIYTPIISLKKIPEIFEDGYKSENIKRQKYLLMMAEDLSNLCKLALYKVLHGEEPLPLFSFTNNDVPLVGTFTRMDDADDIPIFFYTNLKKKPEHGFVKYSSSIPEKTGFTDNTEDHGYLYGKIIRLCEKHPLVEI